MEQRARAGGAAVVSPTLKRGTNLHCAYGAFGNGDGVIRKSSF